MDWIEKDLIPTARERAEIGSGRQFLTATWEIYLDGFPCLDWPIHVPLGQFQSLVNISYVDSDNQPQTIDVAELVLRGGPDYKRISHVSGWPTGRDPVIEFTCGYGNDRDSLPPWVGRVLAMYCKHYYDEGRQNVVIGTSVTKVPGTADDIVNQHALGNEFSSFDPSSQMYRI